MSATRFASTLMPSPLPGVSPKAWKQYVDVCDVQPHNAISASGGYGSYDLRPRRLVELGYATNLGAKITDNRRNVHTCEFVLPWTEKRFLSDFLAQYAAFSRSNLLYHRALLSGELKKPDEMSLSGALAILHLGGRGALEQHDKLFSNTREMYERAKEIF